MECSAYYRFHIASRIIVWNGIKGVAHMVDAQAFSNEDKETFVLMGKPAYGKLREQLHQDLYRWFKTIGEQETSGNGNDEDDQGEEDAALWTSRAFQVHVKLSTLHRYDVARSFGSAQAWLWTLPSHGSRDLRHTDLIFVHGADFVFHDNSRQFWEGWRFWDMDRLGLVTKGLCPQSLEEMHRIEATMINLDPREYDENIVGLE
jgi:hypothetical protein